MSGSPHRTHSLDILMPEAQRLELFSREHRQGWTSWGDECGKFGAADDQPELSS